MFTRIAAGVLLALLMDAAPAQDAAAADDVAATQAKLAAAEAEPVSANAETALQHMRGVYEAAGAFFLDLSTSIAPRDWMLASQVHMLLDPPNPAYSGKVRAELLRNAAAAPDDALVQRVAMTAMPGDGGKSGCAAPAGLPANMDKLLRLGGVNGGRAGQP